MKGILIQYAAAFVVAQLNTFVSFPAVWPSYSLKILKSEQSPLGFSVSESEASLIASVPMLGSLISTLAAQFVLEAFGRKKTNILCALLCLVAWSLIATARTMTQIITGRFISGVSAGIGLVTAVVFNSEITQLSVRGSASTMNTLIYNFGVLFSYLLGWFGSYQVICYVNMVGTLLYVMVVFCLKESPVYLLKMGREKEALSSLKFYRGESETTGAILEELSYLRSLGGSNAKEISDVEKPMIRVQSEKKVIQDEKEDAAAKTDNKSSWVLLYTVEANRRALITLAVFMVLCVCMGMVAVQAYAGQFFADAAPSLSPDMCSVLLAVVTISTCALTMAVTDLVTRRFLMTSTCGIATLCLATLGAAIRWKGLPEWLPIVTILVFCVCFHLGIINIVFVQISESFGPQVNSAASALILCCMFSANFLVLFFFNLSVVHFGIDVTFFIFATIAAFTTVSSVFFTKETRRVPIGEVQKMYASGYLYNKIYVTKEINS